MRIRNHVQTIEKNKVISIWMLFITSVTIIMLGIFFSIISLLNDINFTVMNAQVNGAIFGLVAAFLGIRYFFSVKKLKAEVYKSTAKFSWSNFKKQKTSSKY